MGDLPENFNQKSHHQTSDHDKAHTFIPQQVKLENQEAGELRQGTTYSVFLKFTVVQSILVTLLIVV